MTGTGAAAGGSRIVGAGKRIALVVLGLAAGLLAAEALLRITGLAPQVVRVRRGRYQLSSNPDLGYEPVPHFEHRGATDSFHDYPGSSNSLGFRDREHPPVKPRGTFRILVLGDSVAVGQGIAEMEDTYPFLVERGLNAHGLPAEILSFAVSGYNTLQEVAIFEERGRDFDPDLVLVAYCLNDHKRSDGWILPTLWERRAGEGGLVASRLDPRLMRSALYRFVRFHLPPPEAGPIPGGDSRAEAFDRLARLAREDGFRVLVVIFPRFGKILEYRFGEHHREVAAMAREQGFLLLDLLRPFQDCWRTATGPLGFDRFHPTPFGHRCAARATVEHLLSHQEEVGAFR